jgi:hypothetical protein
MVACCRQTSVMSPAAFKLPPRQTESLTASVLMLISLTLEVPDHTTISGRALTLHLNQLMDRYYGFLAISALKFCEQKFWTSHKKRLSELRYPFSQAKLAKAIVTTVFSLLLNPKSTFEKLRGSRQIPGYARLRKRARGSA